MMMVMKVGMRVMTLFMVLKFLVVVPPVTREKRPF